MTECERVANEFITKWYMTLGYNKNDHCLTTSAIESPLYKSIARQAEFFLQVYELADILNAIREYTSKTKPKGLKDVLQLGADIATKDLKVPSVVYLHRASYSKPTFTVDDLFKYYNDHLPIKVNPEQHLRTLAALSKKYGLDTVLYMIDHMAYKGLHVRPENLIMFLEKAQVELSHKYAMVTYIKR